MDPYNSRFQSHGCRLLFALKWALADVPMHWIRDKISRNNITTYILWNAFWNLITCDLFQMHWMPYVIPSEHTSQYIRYLGFWTRRGVHQVQTEFGIYRRVGGPCAKFSVKVLIPEQDVVGWEHNFGFWWSFSGLVSKPGKTSPRQNNCSKPNVGKSQLTNPCSDIKTWQWWVFLLLLLFSDYCLDINHSSIFDCNAFSSSEFDQPGG